MSKQLESITFFTCLREAIALSIEGMEGLNEYEIKDLQNFVINESSDYEIMNFSVTGKFPSEKYNPVMESVLVDEIKGILFEGYHTLLETMSEDQIDGLVESLVPLSEYGLSSSQLIMEHLSHIGLMPSLLAESERTRAIESARKKDWAARQKTAANAVDFGSTGEARQGGANYLYKQDQKERAKASLGAFDPELHTPRGKSRLAAAKNKVAGAKEDLKDREDTVSNANVGFAAGEGGGINLQQKSKWQSAIDAVRTFAKSKTGKALGATVVAAGLLYGGYKTYKRFFSKAAKACSNYSGAEKTACMEKYKVTAIKAQIADLRKAMSACKNSSNPQKCQSTIQAKISKLQAKAAK